MGTPDFLGINYNPAALLLNPNGGNVGVGTTNPPGKTLDVNGDLGVSGNVSVDGLVTIAPGPVQVSITTSKLPPAGYSALWQ